MVMKLRRKWRPDKAFSHAPDCKILAADPDVQIPWSEIRRGVWEARCQCGFEYVHGPVADDRVRLDPLDPKTSRHAGQCNFVSETDPTMIRAVLRVTDKDGYWWVECNSCSFGWRVPHYAANPKEAR